MPILLRTALAWLQALSSMEGKLILLYSFSDTSQKLLGQSVNVSII